MIENTDGWVAIKYYQTIPHICRLGDGTEYAFAVQARICLAWIRPQHVNTVLHIVKVCCGGNKKTVYRLANESDVRQWTQRGGR
jgi:hypothetical protein